MAARRKAGAKNDLWRTVLRRLQGQFPADNVHNDSLGLATGGMDAAYSCKVFPAAAPHLTIGFLVSFLVPYYVVYRSRIVHDPPLDPPPGQIAKFQISLPWDEEADAPGPAVIEDVLPTDRTRFLVGFDFSPEEQPHAAEIIREVEAAWRYAPMPPEVGKVIVPDVSTNLRCLGEATLYDCLFADHWLR